MKKILFSIFTILILATTIAKSQTVFRCGAPTLPQNKVGNAQVYYDTCARPWVEYHYQGKVWTIAVSSGGGGITGVTTTSKLTGNGNGAPLSIAVGGVGNNELSTNAVTSAKITDSTIVASDLSAILNNTINSKLLASDTSLYNSKALTTSQLNYKLNKTDTAGLASDNDVTAVRNLANTKLNVSDTSLYNSKALTTAQLAGKQETLVSGTSIKTVNGNSLLGSGNITITGGAGSVNTGDSTQITVIKTGQDSIKAIIKKHTIDSNLVSKIGLQNIANIDSLSDFSKAAGLSGTTSKSYYINTTDTTAARKIADGKYELLEVKSYTPPVDTVIGSNTYYVTQNTRWHNNSLSANPSNTTVFTKQQGVFRPAKPLTILDFGGNGDGVTNNDAAFTRYKNYNVANGISEINIPDGTFVMTRWNVPANIKIIGNGTRTTILKSTTKGYMLYCGDSTYAYGIELRNFAINALNDSITAIRLINTAGASVSNIYIEGNLGSTNRTIGVEVAGGQNGNIFSKLDNIICNHIWKGYLFSRSSPTQTSTTMLSCSSLGDISSFPSIGSIGLEIQGANGQGSSIIGCNFESCDIGILNGGEQTFFSGNRFEGNNTDISNTSTSISNSYIGNQSLTSTKVSDLGTRNTFLSNTAFDTYQDIPNVLSGTLKVQLQAGTSTDSIVTATNGKLNRGVITDYAWSKLGNAGTNANTHFVGTTDNTQLTFRQNNTQRMFITSDGVGIGTGLTTNFGQSLAVQGNILLHNINNTRGIVTSGDASNTGSIYIQSGGGSVGHGGGASFYAHSNVLYPGWTVANISSSSGTVGTATEGRFAVTNQGINVGAILFSVVRSGNVGINTTTPQYKLDIDAKTASAGDPIRLQGLKPVTTADSVGVFKTAEPGVMKSMSLAQVVQAGATSFTASYDNFIAGGGGRDSVVITVLGLTTATGLAAVSYTSIQHDSGIIIQPAKIETGQIKIYLDNFNAAAKAFSGVLKVTILKL